MGAKRYELWKSGRMSFDEAFNVSRKKLLPMSAVKDKVLPTPKVTIPITKPIVTPKIVAPAAKKAVVTEIAKDISAVDEPFDFFAALAESQNTIKPDAKIIKKTTFVSKMIEETKLKAKILDEKIYKTSDKTVAYSENATQLTGKSSGSITNINAARKARTLEQYANRVNMLEEFEEKLTNGYLENVTEPLLSSYFDMIANQKMLKGDDFVRDFIELNTLGKSRIELLIERSSNAKQKKFYTELLKTK